IPGTLYFMMRETQYDWNITMEADQRVETCHQQPNAPNSLGRMLGGTSSMSYLMYSRGIPRDYNSWAALLGDDTWKWENVLPYFRKAESVAIPKILASDIDKDLYGTEGYFKVSVEKYDDDEKYFQTCNDMGYQEVPDLNENHPLGCSRMKIAVGDGARQSTARAYLTPIKDRPNLYVTKHTQVTKILFDGNKNAIGVEALTNDGKTMVYKSTKEVIVSAGAINTAKLLMLSGVGPKDQLQKHNIEVISELPVGENLQDHVSTILIHKTEKASGPPPPMNPYEYPAPTILSHLTFDKSQGQADYQVGSFIVPESIVLYYCTYNFRFKHQICDDLYTLIKGRKAIFHMLSILNTKTRGKVALKSSNALDHPVIDYKYLSNEEDLENTVNSLEDFSRIVETTHLKNVNAELVDPVSVNCGQFSKQSKEFWKCYSSCMFSGYNYFAGTCAMGSVVDTKLKVKGVQNLRVVDASVMPTITSTGVMGPAIMIGEKGADIIKQEFGLS
ncbi:glucose dehydrogenase [FAD, quinone]-like, partial [Manduca sexta]|uniref:glucose dehydrogenase [FAD, quinone]-like n=1 Tax=Manduca sexta TaxID=7130 RepID=UPI0018904FA8